MFYFFCCLCDKIKCMHFAEKSTVVRCSVTVIVCTRRRRQTPARSTARIYDVNRMRWLHKHSHRRCHRHLRRHSKQRRQQRHGIMTALSRMAGAIKRIIVELMTRSVAKESIAWRQCTATCKWCGFSSWRIHHVHFTAFFRGAFPYEAHYPF